MIPISNILKSYDLKKLTIAVLGGHSGLDVCHGAKKLGFRTLAVCQKGREKTYSHYYKSQDGKGCVDEVMLLDKFSDVLDKKNQQRLLDLNTIFVHNRYFWVYFKDFNKIEKDFKVPIFGTRHMVRLEERDEPGNQYGLLKKAGIRTPKIFRKGGEILSEKNLSKLLDKHFVNMGGGPLLVKAAEEERGYERDFFTITTEKDYFNERSKRNAKLVDRATIEEYVIGPQINFNYFYSPLAKRLELMGTDTRRQTNLDGFLRLSAQEQLDLLQSGFRPSMIENGHIACTVKESILEKAFELGEKFVKTTQKVCKPGIIGPFALQGAYVSEQGKEDFVVFDVSMRIPGSPGTRFTPYTGYLHGETISYGERIAMEIKSAAEKERLEELLT
ncbi:MAG: DUF1297 domain-containing protein [bacterium]|nr:DUF1297 domain-containing protein [bacterium]